MSEVPGIVESEERLWKISSASEISRLCAVEVRHSKKRIQAREGMVKVLIPIGLVWWRLAGALTLDATAAMRIRVHGKAGFGYLSSIPPGQCQPVRPLSHRTGSSWLITGERGSSMQLAIALSCRRRKSYLI